MRAQAKLEANCYIALSSSGLLKVYFPFDAVTNAQLVKIRPKGICNGIKEYWEFPLSAGPSLIEVFSQRFVIEKSVFDWIKLLQNPLPDLPPTSEFVKRGDFSKQLIDGRKPLPHQSEGARWLVSMRGALLADEMGLGKTLTALLAARAISRSVLIKVMVIAPVGLHNHWLKEANSLSLKIDLYSWARIPSELNNEGTLLIVDEAHFAQSINSKRTKALLRLSRHPYLRCIWLLTGTPIKNGRPKQIYPLLAAIHHPITLNRSLYEHYFVDTNNIFNNQLVLNTRKLDKLNELRKSIKPFTLNRKKNIILDLPLKNRKKYQIKLSSNENKGLEHRINLVIENYRNRVEKGLVRKETEALVVLSAMRQITAEFKLSFVSKLLRDEIGKENPVILFSNFLQPLYLLKRYENGQLLTGRQTINEREKVVNDFQLGKINMLLCTYGAAGVGFTLHRARNVILLDRPWSPGEVEQAEDRCHRLGMKGDLLSHWPQLGLVDELVDTLIASKDERIKIIFGSKKIELKRQSFINMVTSFFYNVYDI